MPASTHRSAAVERDAVRGVARACRAGLDSAALRAALAERLLAVVPAEVAAVGTLDPATGLMTHGGSAYEPPGYLDRFLHRAYLRGEAECIIELARSGRVVSTTPSPIMADFLRPEGLGREVRVVFSDAAGWWGVFCATREPSSPSFTEREARLLRRLAPHVALGLRRAALVDMAGAADRAGASLEGTSLDDTSLDGTPGVLVVDARGRTAHRTASAARHLADLAAADHPAGNPSEGASPATALPAAAVSVLAQLRAAPEGSLRARGASGRWYALTASASEPDPAGDSARVVVVTPVGRAAAAPTLARLYGLSAREREVLTLVARGDGTKEIAARLGLSPYTVQDHVDRAAEKVGVRGRRALLARLFLDGASA